jgi:hypothetical protein
MDRIDELFDPTADDPDTSPGTSFSPNLGQICVRLPIAILWRYLLACPHCHW